MARRGVPIPTETKAAIVAAFRDTKMSAVEIGDKFGVDPSSAVRFAREAGIQREMPRGQDSRNSILTDADVLEIRNRYKGRGNGGPSQAELAKEYGVSPALISAVITRTKWGHVMTDEERHERGLKRWREQLAQAQEDTGKPLANVTIGELMTRADIPLSDDLFIVGLKGAVVISRVPAPDKNGLLHVSNVVYKFYGGTTEADVRAALGLPQRAVPVVSPGESDDEADRRAAIRAWARAAGFEVSDGGRVPQDVVDAFDRAQEKRLACGDARGTYRGWSRHMKEAGDQACSECLAAKRDYQARNKRERAARQRGQASTQN